MLIGKGMIAKEFKEYMNHNDFIICASGVSNSKETNFNAFLREQDLLLNILSKYYNKTIVYFSTCSIYDNYFEHNLYTKHKLDMEDIIKKNAKSYLIFRLPQVLGNNNPHQLMGFLFEKIKNGESFELYDIERNIIDIYDVKVIVNYILENNIYKNHIINVANPENIKVIDLVKKIEQNLSSHAKYTIVNKEGSFCIDTKDIAYIIKKFNLFDKNYIDRIVKKYYE